MHGVVAVTGGSSGIGLATARLFAKKGYTVYELSRNGSGEDGIKHITADVTDEQSVTDAFALIFSKEGRLDILVNNAGFGISGAIETAGMSSVQKQFDVNFFGAVRCIQQALPYFRKSGGGHIVNISSVGGPLALPFQAFYSCTKSAINALTLAAANELRPFGISVCAVMPGDVRTGFTAAREKSTDGSELYGSTVEKSVASMEHDEQNGMKPEKIAKKVYKMSRKKNPKPLCTVGLQYKFFMLLWKVLPASMVNRIVGMLYS